MLSSGISGSCGRFRASQVVLAVKNPPAKAGDARDVGSIPGSGRCPGEEWQSVPLSAPVKSHGQKSLAGYMGSQRVGHS